MKKILLFFVIVFFVGLSFRSVELHPYHVGALEFSHNPETSTFEITGKFFTDDLENAINKRYKTALYFYKLKSKAMMDSYLEKYFEENIGLKVNDKEIKLHYLGFEEDREVVNVYLESSVVKSPRKVEVAVRTLYNLFNDQINIIHLVVGEKRQSHKLSFPEIKVLKIF